MKKLSLIAAAAALAATPVVAQSLPAISPVTGDESELGDSGATILAVALVAGIAAIAVIAATNGDDTPVSA